MENKQTENACSECANRLKLKVIGMTGSWAPVKCAFCNERNASLIVVCPDQQLKEAP